jgi:hypothetical protein
MTNQAGTCPLTQRQQIDEYFIEHRTKILDIAAFLDRLDRASALDAGDDFRLAAFKQALRLLCTDEPGRMARIQLALSDRNLEPLDTRDHQNAFGAPEPKS